MLFSAKYILLLQNYIELKLQQRTTDKQRNKNDEPGAGRSRIAESVKQRVGDGGNVAKLQDVLTVGRAGELRQLAQLWALAVRDAVDDGADRLERVRGRYGAACVDVRVAVSHQNHHLYTGP